MMEWYIQIFIFHSTSRTTAESALLVTLNTTQRMDDAPGPRINNQLSIWLISHQLKRLGPVRAAGWRQLWSGSGGPRLADQRNGRLPNGLLADSERSCPAASFPATAVSPFPISGGAHCSSLPHAPVSSGHRSSRSKSSGRSPVPTEVCHEIPLRLRELPLLAVCTGTAALGSSACRGRRGAPLLFPGQCRWSSKKFFAHRHGKHRPAAFRRQRGPFDRV